MFLLHLASRQYSNNLLMGNFTLSVGAKGMCRFKRVAGPGELEELSQFCVSCSQDQHLPRVCLDRDKYVELSFFFPLLSF